MYLTQAPLTEPPATGPGRRRVEPQPRAEAARRRRLQRDLAAAVEAGAFVLDFQPRLSLGTGRQTTAEALIRWPHPRRGQVPAAAFIPMAEAAGRGAALGGWALASACRAAAAWADPWTVSVRVLAHQIDRGTLLGQVATALEASGLDPERLELGLAETTLADVSLDTLLMLSAIRDLGTGLALDDFGTGPGSLTMLKRLPLTALKLDRSLVRDLPADREDAAIVRSLIGVGHALGLTVIAAGIDTEPQRAFLAGSGCDEGLGGLFGTAMAGG